MESGFVVRFHGFHIPVIERKLQSKIRAVHDAARTGNLRQLQAALDRRKFAVARDRRAQSAATPLHLAVLLGQTAVVRYLAGRFPETLMARDIRGRTALHYAACLADNGHYYNLLLNLGANRSVKDKVGICLGVLCMSAPTSAVSVYAHLRPPVRRAGARQTSTCRTPPR